MAGKIEPLHFTRSEPSFGIGTGTHGDHRGKVILWMGARGFEAQRVMTRDDLIDIRDWINTALAETSELEATE